MFNLVQEKLHTQDVISDVDQTQVKFLLFSNTLLFSFAPLQHSIFLLWK